MTINCTNASHNSSIPTQGCLEQNPELLRFSSAEKIACYSVIYGLISLIALVGNRIISLLKPTTTTYQCGIRSELALFGNTLVCFVIMKNPRMRTVTNVFLLNLAVADILFILVTVPAVMNMEIVPNYWVFGELLCKTIPFINTVTLSTSIYTMVVLAVDRYYAVVHPLRAKIRHTVKRTSCLIAAIWIASLLVALPQIPSRVLVRRHQTNEVICGQDWNKLGGKLGLQIYSVAIFCIFFAVPISIITLAYSTIIKKLRNTDKALSEVRRLRQKEAKKDSQSDKEDSLVVSRHSRKTTFMMLTVIIIFLICMLPFNVFIIVTHFLSEETSKANQEVIVDANAVLTIFAIASSACNPIIYNFFSVKFRKAFADVFCCKCMVNVQIMRTEMTSEFNKL